MKRVAIIGGGLAGLVSSILLSRRGIPCILFEKRTYPLHRVCGEYVSNETLPFLEKHRLLPSIELPRISRFQLSSVKGRSITLPLDLGGFGISRNAFDTHFFRLAVEAGVEVRQHTEVESIVFDQHDGFTIRAKDQSINVNIAIGAFGKRSRLDAELKRAFIKKRSPYVGVKYHIKTEHAVDLIALHNFPGGYCGISNVEGGVSNLCYLTEATNLRKAGSIKAMEEESLCKNPLLRNIFRNSEFLFTKPETIGEISFETKGPVEQHVLMAGDAAGMIAPLCGNGMAMAIHSGSLLAEWAARYCNDGHMTRNQLERGYAREWKIFFARRLWTGRQLQRLFGSQAASAFAVGLCLRSRRIAGALIRNSHGRPFE